VTRTPLSRSKGQRSTYRGRSILWRPPAQLVGFASAWKKATSSVCWKRFSFQRTGAINNALNDDDDIKREINNLFMCTNMLINRYRKCSINVKLTLFKSFCMSMYDLCLWKHYSVTVLNKFRSCYNKCIKKFFLVTIGVMSEILILLSLPTADTILYNSRIVFQQHCVSSCNKIVKWLVTVGLWSVFYDLFLFFLFF